MTGLEDLRVTGYRKDFAAGIDLGQKQDHTAVALIERTTMVYDRRDPVTWDFLSRIECRLVHAERLPLGVPYPDVVEHVAKLMGRAPLGETPTLVVDATGVGGPVVDLFRARRMPGRLVPVIITGGDSVKQEGATFRVPKRDLIAGLQVAFETRSLLIDAEVPAVDTFIAELMSMRSTVTAKGPERIEAWREGSHDDVVLAVALAWWQMLMTKTVTGSWLLRQAG